jgi:hypothetical protein
VEEKDQHTNAPDEEKDVEAHGNVNAPTKGAPSLNEDDGDDVEAHVNLASPTKDSPSLN